MVVKTGASSAGGADAEGAAVVVTNAVELAIVDVARTTDVSRAISVSTTETEGFGLAVGSAEEDAGASVVSPTPKLAAGIDEMTGSMMRVEAMMIGTAEVSSSITSGASVGAASTAVDVPEITTVWKVLLVSLIVVVGSSEAGASKPFVVVTEATAGIVVLGNAHTHWHCPSAPTLPAPAADCSKRLFLSFGKGEAGRGDGGLAWAYVSSFFRSGLEGNGKSGDIRRSRRCRWG